MSADNWTVCPGCEKDRQSQLAQVRADLDAAYGKVPVDEFDRMRASADVAFKAPATQTWREDWEIGVFDGDLYINYSGGCSVCKRQHKFHHEAPVDVS